MNLRSPLIVRTALAALALTLAAAPLAAEPIARRQPANGKLKIFILSGQSNMVGFGTVASAAGAASPTPGTMDACLKARPKSYGHLVDKAGKPVVRDDVWIVDLSYPDKQRSGWLTAGFGASEGHIGPEYAFGFVVGDYYEDPVLLIKSAWGGRSLFHNFLPPSAGEYPKPVKDGDKGFQYAEILRHVKEITGDIKKHFPTYAGKGYEIVGFGWHQGWNDRINPQAVDAYESNMVHFINDIRRDLGAANLPFVIANTGIGGWDIPEKASYKERVEKHMAAQLAAADAAKYPQFSGNVAAVETRDFMRKAEESPSKQEFHWNRNWETYYLIGKSMGESMVAMLAGAGGRPAKGQFKGMWLYSWKDENDRWAFALLPGKNDEWTPAQVMEPGNRLYGVNEVKAGFSQLAPGESVSWHHRNSAFAFPPAAIRAEIVRCAKEMQVKLAVSE